MLRRPKLVALLAYLAAARPHGFHRRDRLLAIFWPELDQPRARNALRQAVFHLRTSLGADALLTRGDEELAVNPARVRCDVVAFDELLAAGREAAALELVRGELLPGFHLSDAPDFERWLDEEREHLHRQTAIAAGTLAQAEEKQGNLAGAAHWARLGAEVAPYDEDGLRTLLGVLDRAGDRAGALQAYDRFARRLEADLGVQPAPETQAVVRAIRTRIGEHEPGVGIRPVQGVVAQAPGAAPVNVDGPTSRAAEPAGGRPQRVPGARALAVTIIGGTVAIFALADSGSRRMIAGGMGYQGTLLAGLGLLLIILAQWADTFPDRTAARPKTQRGVRLTAWLAGYGLVAGALTLHGYYASTVLVVLLALVTALARPRAERAARAPRLTVVGRGGVLQVALLVASFVVEGRLIAQPQTPRNDTVNVFVVLSFEPSTTLSPTLAMRLWQTYVRTFANVFTAPAFHVHPQQFTAEAFSQFTLQETPEAEIVERLRQLRPPPDLILTSAVRYTEVPDFVRIGSFVRRVEGGRLSAPLTRAIVQEGHVDDVWHHALIAATSFLAAIEVDAGVALPDSVEQQVLRQTLDLFADGVATQTDDADAQPGLDSLKTMTNAGLAITPFDVLSVLSQFSHGYDTPDDAARRRSALAKVFRR